jgi:hypothetical protein
MDELFLLAELLYFLVGKRSINNTLRYFLSGSASQDLFLFE